MDTAIFTVRFLLDHRCVILQPHDFFSFLFDTTATLSLASSSKGRKLQFRCLQLLLWVRSCLVVRSYLTTAGKTFLLAVAYLGIHNLGAVFFPSRYILIYPQCSLALKLSWHCNFFEQHSIFNKIGYNLAHMQVCSNEVRGHLVAW
jgi:hypothetical protein